MRQKVYYGLIGLLAFANVVVWIASLLLKTKHLTQCVFVSIFTVMVCSGLYKHQRDDPVTLGVTGQRSAAAVAELPVYNTFCVTVKDLENPSECSICLDAYEEGQIACTLPCGHQFHAACLQTWNKSCPFNCGKPPLPVLNVVAV